MNKKIPLPLILLVLPGLLLAACTPAASTPTPGMVVTVVSPPVMAASPTPELPTTITVTDALGRTVILDQPPRRIVLAGKAVIMLADAVYMFPGASDRVVGISSTDQGMGDFIAAIDPNYGAKMTFETEVSAEQVITANPDLVLMKSYLADSLGTPLESLGIPVIYLDFETPEQYERDLATLGQVFQDETRASELIAFYQAGVAQVTAPLADLTDDQKPRALILYYSNKGGEVAFNVPPVGWIQTTMVQNAGGIPVWTDIELGRNWTQVTLEQIATWDPDKIFIVSYKTPASDVVSSLLADPQWQALRASREGQLYAFPADFYSWDQADARWLLGQKWLAAQMHPERFVGLDILQEARNFFLTLYALDEAAFDSTVQPVLIGLK